MASTFAAYLTYGRVVWIAHESSWVLRGLISTLGPVGFLFYLPMEAFGFFLVAKMFTVFAPVLVGKTLFVATRDGWLFARPYAMIRNLATTGKGRPCFS